AALFELHGALLLVDADDVLGAFLVQLVADGLAGHGLVLAGIAEQALLLPVIDTGIETDHRNLGRERRLDVRRFGIREGQRQGDAVDVLLHDVGDQLRFLIGVRARQVDELDVVLLGGGVRAFADDIPERIAWLRMGDHGDRVLRSVAVSRPEHGGSHERYAARQGPQGFPADFGHVFPPVSHQSVPMQHLLLSLYFCKRPLKGRQLKRLLAAPWPWSGGGRLDKTPPRQDVRRGRGAHENPAGNPTRKERKAWLWRSSRERRADWVR